MTLPAIFGFLLEHADLFQMLFDAISNGRLTKESATRALQRAVWEASDVEMDREFPKEPKP
jgi:hypothetical protein